jgi:methylated-DNA-[protein]-cysteine S-methyltransferase
MEIETENYTSIESPLGKVLIVANAKFITGVYLPENPLYLNITKQYLQVPNEFSPLLKRASVQLIEYFEGKRLQFDLPTLQEGRPLQKLIWERASKLPYGETMSYSSLAKSMGYPRAARAVGYTMGKNQNCIIIPCHRLIALSGKLAGYNGGIAAKEWLLNHEQKHKPKIKSENLEAVSA